MRTMLSLLVACSVIHSACADTKETPPAGAGSELKDGFTFNSTKKDGRLEWKVEGSAASFVTPDIIEIKNARAIYYAEDGTNAVATSSKALLHKDSRRVTTDEFVTIATQNAVTTGTGLEWDQEKKQATLHKDVKVIYTYEGKGGILR